MKTSAAGTMVPSQIAGNAALVEEAEYPELPQGVVDANTGYYGSAAVKFYPIYFSTRLIAAFAAQFYQYERTQLSFSPTDAIPVWAIRGNAHESKTMEKVFSNRPTSLTMIFDLHDHGKDVLEFTPEMWRSLEHSGGQVVYVKLQVIDRDFYRRNNLLPKQFHVLSVPMLLGGGRSPITDGGIYSDLKLLDEICNQRGTLPYQYDWSWFGDPLDGDRHIALEILRGMTTRPRFFQERMPGREDQEDPGQWYRSYLDALRASRVNISLTGKTVWCHRDAELLASDNFVLRQAHPSLLLCPLSPKNGAHWGVAPTSDLPAMIEYYLENDAERARIRTRGHNLLRSVLFEGYWSRVYIARLDEFLRSSKKAAWADLAIA